ncbi:hypothetical protein V8C86DRAFT_2643455 [Haematococcus lacustris]
MLPSLRNAYVAMPSLALAAAATGLAWRSSNESDGSSAPMNTGWRMLATQAFADAKPAKTGALDPQEFKSFVLIEKEKLTHNTLRLRFELPNNQVSGLNVASCLVTKAVMGEGAEAKPVVRPYTPTSAPDARGYMDLVVKVYPTGNMSKHMGNLKVGDSLEMKGPIPKIPYQANMKKQIGMVAGGTGLTPMLQVIDAVLANPADTTKVSLLYANLTPGDIILKARLDALAAKHADRLKVTYIVDKPGWGGLFWPGLVGRVNKEVLQKTMPPPDPANMVLVCGPPGFMTAVSGNKAKDFTQGELEGALKELGYNSSQVYKF